MNDSKHSPLVSVVIPCYNAEQWIESTLQSVRAQTYRNIEIIVVNDGSTDSSEARIRTFDHPRLTLVTQPNRGQTAALNRGVSLSSGDFTQYLDADDLLHPEKIERQLRLLEGNGGCIATSEWARFSDEIRTARFVPDDNWRDLDPVEWLISAWRDGGGMLFPAQWLIPREIVERAGPWREDLTLNNDAEYFTRAVLAARRILFCEGARAYYRSGIQGSLSGLKSRAAWISQQKVIEACVEYLLNREDSDRTRRVASLLWRRFAHTTYPYDRQIANDALRHAGALHPVSVMPEGGAFFRLTMRILGWKAATVIRRFYYRFRYGYA
ncbi:MAG TPA: glycosyltransferase [Thermoanaerobaculia bacterium]|nr:glycosyltransferase [Thermoanaerobaculia bacterium]